MATPFEGFDFFLTQVNHNLRTLADFAFKHLLTQYQQAMKQLQPHLLEAARQRNSEQEKSQFIAAIEQCQQLQPQMSSAFAFNMMEAMQVLTGEDPDPATQRLIQSSFAALGSHARDDEVYLKNLTERSIKKHRDWTQATTYGLQIALQSKKINAQNNPFSPLVISNALYASLKISNMYSGIRKEIFVLFEQTLFNHLDSFYQQLAQHLADIGINITAPKAQESQGSENASDMEFLSPVDLKLDTIDSNFNEILNDGVIPPDYNHRSYQPMETALFEQSGVTPEIVPVKNLNSLLASIQKGYDPKTDGDLLEHIKRQLELESSSSEILAINHHDENIINLITLVFRQISETQDESIADLFYRLKVPYTRLSLNDELFFHDRKHPARILLDALIELTFSSHDEERLFKQVQHCVTKILLRYKGENALFSDLTEAVNAYIESNETPFAESRKNMAQQFEDAENLRMARAAASKLITQYTNTLPKKLRFHILIEKFWQQTLADIHLQYGQKSAQWQQALYLLECLMTMTDNSNRKKFTEITKQLSGIASQLSEYLSEHGIDPDWKRTFFDQLQEIQIQLMRGKTLKDLDDEDLKHTFEVDMIIDDYESEMVAEIDIATIGHEHKNHKQAQSLQLVPPDKRPGSEATRHFIKRLNPGQWINMLIDGNRTPCFLSYYSQYRQSYIFCDRHNKKLFERQRDDLVDDFVLGFASVLDKTTNFEATLASVIARISAH